MLQAGRYLQLASVLVVFVLSVPQLSGYRFEGGNVLIASVAAIGLGMIGVTIGLVAYMIESLQLGSANALLAQTRHEAALAMAESNSLMAQFESGGTDTASSG